MQISTLLKIAMFLSFVLGLGIVFDGKNVGLGVLFLLVGIVLFIAYKLGWIKDKKAK